MTAHPGLNADQPGLAASHQGLSADEAKVVDAVEKRLYVGGAWVDAAGRRTFDVLDPSTGEKLCSVADAYT